MRDQLLWSAEPLDVANGGKQEHRVVNTNPWELHEERRLLSPRHCHITTW
jgi:hypothetical protein